MPIAETSFSPLLNGCGRRATRTWAAEHCHLVATRVRFSSGMGHEMERLKGPQGVSQRDPCFLHLTAFSAVPGIERGAGAHAEPVGGGLVAKEPLEFKPGLNSNLENTGHLASGQVCYQSVLGGIWAPWAGVASWQILTWGRGTGSGRSHCSHLGLKQGTAWLKALWKGVQASSPHGLQLSI